MTERRKENWRGWKSEPEGEGRVAEPDRGVTHSAASRGEGRTFILGAVDIKLVNPPGRVRLISNSKEKGHGGGAHRASKNEPGGSWSQVRPGERVSLGTGSRMLLGERGQGSRGSLPTARERPRDPLIFAGRHSERHVGFKEHRGAGPAGGFRVASGSRRSKGLVTFQGPCPQDP